MTQATLAGIALTGHAPIRWPRQGGVAPSVTTILTSTERAERIWEASNGVPVELVLEGNGKRKVFKNLWVIGKTAGDGPHTTRLTVADWRWALPRIWITLEANITRLSVERVQRGPSLEVASLIPAQVYAPHSLNNGAPFDAKAVLSVFCDRLTREMANAEVPVQLAPLPAAVPTVEVVSWLVDHSGDDAVAVLFQLLPGLQLEADDEGRARFYFETGEAEKDEVRGSLVYAEAGNQYPVIMDRRRFRPSAVEVMFEKRMELAFTYREGVTGTSTVSYDQPGFDLINVVQVKEPIVTSADVRINGWMPFDEYITYLSQQTRPAGAQAEEFKPSMNWVRQNFCSGFSRCRVVFQAGGRPDPLWSARFDTIMSHYRQTFALSQYWYERLSGLEAIRTHKYSSSLNVHAPAEAYCNYTLRPTWHNVDPSSGASKGKWAAVNDNIYSYGQTLNDRNPAPFMVVMEDQDAMIIRLVPRPELSRMSDLVFPGTIIDGPDKDAVNAINNAAAGGYAQGLWEWVSLHPTFELAVILTASIATPNDYGRYHIEFVFPSQAQEVVKNFKVGEANGPVLTVRCPIGVIEARSGWVDAAKAEITNCVELGTNIPTSCFGNPEQVRDVAVAIAARIYESLTDRLSGERVKVSFKPDMKPVGALQQVVHEVEMSGRLTTSFSFAQVQEPRDFTTFLPAATRRIIQKVPTMLRGR